MNGELFTSSTLRYIGSASSDLAFESRSPVVATSKLELDPTAAGDEVRSIFPRVGRRAVRNGFSLMNLFASSSLPGFMDIH